MSDESGAPAGDFAAPAVTSLPADAPETFSSPSDAAKYFTDLKQKKPAAESAEEATAANKSASQEDDAAPEEGTTVEDQGTEPEVPAIDPPRSWSKDAHERWSKLDRETQEFLASRDSEDQKAIKRGLNEAAEARKAAQVELTQAAEARKALASKLPEVEKAIQGFLSDNYPDIKTMADVERMAAEDPFRKIQWDTHQQKIAAALTDARTAHEQQKNADLTAWRSFATEESKKLSEFVSEKEISTYTPKAGDFLANMEFTDSERDGFVNGEKISLFDHRMQRILLNAMKYEEIQKAPKAVASKDLPPVLRPGTSKPAGSGNSEQIQALTRQLNETGSLKVAQQLRALQSRRAS